MVMASLGEKMGNDLAKKRRKICKISRKIVGKTEAILAENMENHKN